MSALYDLDALRAVVKRAPASSTDMHLVIGAGQMLLNAARAGLLDDAALGRAVRAAAERDGPERDAMDAAIAQTLYYGLPGQWGKQAQAAARALVAMGGQDGR